MIKVVDKISDLKKEIEKFDKNVKLDYLINLDFPFFDNRQKFTLISLPTYDEENPNNIILLSKSKIIIYSKNKPNGVKEFGEVLEKDYGESTVSALLLLREIIKNYSKEFERIRNKMNSLDVEPVLDEIENSGRQLRKLTDRLEELVRIIILLRERDVREFDVSLVQFDYEMLNAEARYWLERCRSHIYRVATLRTKSEMKSNKELNDTMRRLTVIVTFLTIVSIVVSVPGTIGAIFGIPALSEAYFSKHVLLLVFTLTTATLLSILLGMFYWKKLGLR